MGRGNLIQNSLQLTPFNRSRETERERERWLTSRRNSVRDATAIDSPIISPTTLGTICLLHRLFLISILAIPSSSSLFLGQRNFDQLSVT